MELKELIKNSEERSISYKKLLEELYKNKINVEWYNNLLRESKNFEQSWLKKLVEEKRYENEGLNPPFFYLY